MFFFSLFFFFFSSSGLSQAYSTDTNFFLIVIIGNRYIEVAPEDVIWANLGMNPYEQKVRSFLPSSMLRLRHLPPQFDDVEVIPPLLFVSWS